MSTASINAPKDLSERQRRMYRGSFFLVIIGEAMIFVTLFSTRFLLAGTGHPDTLNTPLGLAVTVLLVISLAPLALGLGRVQKGSSGASWLWLAVLLGLIALALIVYDWSTLQVAVGSRYGENYVMSTGYHALHILLGLIGLAVIAGADGHRAFTAGNHWQVEAAAMFWTFVVMTWLILYAVFFIY
ncbi:cytochrome c oxidase subunit 3 [Thioclava sp. DLFJ4-1]|uniref:cytochrome c oxidase subunit 3 n=1 Tax=Thioclava sp. DLFJ4-1 TaxID=1915313 RepID=UPI0009C9F006|nr:cytochrome c oxidase subunit 3 [Thioclava sp. DLFJ4-1]OOY14429.1 hypothetical protein BMI85_20180 [Thioclava sp. DLFJ4-1]